MPTVWGKTRRATTVPTTPGMRNLFVLDGNEGPTKNCGNLNYHNPFNRSYTGLYVIEPDKAVARYDLNGGEGFKVDGSEIYEARWKPDDGLWYMTLPHTGMPCEKCTLFWANPLTGLKKGLYLGWGWPMHGWVPEEGILLRPYNDQNNRDKFTFWKIDPESPGGWSHAGTYQWSIKLSQPNVSGGGLKNRKGWYRTRYNYEGTILQSIDIETVSVEGGSISRSYNTYTRFALVTGTVSDPCDNDQSGSGQHYSGPLYVYAIQSAPSYHYMGSQWTPIVWNNNPDGSSQYGGWGTLRSDGLYMAGAEPIEIVSGPYSYILRRNRYVKQADHNYQVYCWKNGLWGPQWVYTTSNLLVKETAQELNLYTAISPATYWEGMGTGAIGDAWAQGPRYMVLRSCTYVPPQWYPVYYNKYICVDMTDFSWTTIEWSDYAVSLPGYNPPDSCRFYEGVPYLHAYHPSSPVRVLINMLTGTIYTPRTGSWLWNGDYPPTQADGKYGYNGPYFYEEYQGGLFVVFHGHVTIALTDITEIHVAAASTATVEGCGAGTCKAKATFTIQDIFTEAAVESATVSVSMAAYCDDVLINGPHAASGSTDSEGKVTFTFPSCVGCGGGAALEIRFEVTGVASTDTRNYRPESNFAEIATWSPEPSE